MVSSTLSGMPISAIVTSPQWSRPGSRRWPGFRRKKVTVAAASMATPLTAPVVPSMPLGTSTETTGRADAFTASIKVASLPSTGRARPAPSSASTTTSAPASASGPSASRAPVQRSGHCRGVRRQARRIAVESETHPIAPLGEVPRRHETVAAIVARSAKHCDRARVGKAARNLLGHGAAGILHEDRARHPALRSASRSASPISSAVRSSIFKAPAHFLCIVLIS